MRNFFFSLVAILVAGVFVFTAPTVLPVAAQENPSDVAADEASAQETEESEDEPPIEEAITTPLEAEAGEDKNIIVGREVLFDGSASTNDREGDLTYLWDFGDGTTETGITASHEYKRSGTYRASLTVDNTDSTHRDEIIVSVAEDLVVFITDRTISDEDITQIQQFAATQEVLVVNVRSKSKDVESIVSSKLASEIIEAKGNILQASLIIVQTDGNIGVSALSEVAQTLSLSEEPEALTEYGWSNKVIVVLGEEGVAQNRIAQTTFNILQPQFIILTTPDAVRDVILAKKGENVTDQLQSGGYTYEIISVTSQRALENLTPFNFMSYGINYLVNKGVPSNNILLILMLPIIATIIAIARQIGGIKAFGIYAPSIIALSFIVTGIKFGLLFFFVLLATGTLTRLIAKRFRLLYMPRIALVLTAVALSILAVFLGAGATGQTGLLGISIFPILIMTVLTEQFVAVQIEKGARTAIRLTVETLGLSILGYYVVSWDTLKDLILGFPELIFLVILINIVIGRWAGLRLSEYWRFRHVLKNAVSTKDK